jgi:hypothetical protein
LHWLTLRTMEQVGQVGRVALAAAIDDLSGIARIQ